MIARRHSLIAAGGLLAAPALAQQAEDAAQVQGFSRTRFERFAPAMAREIERGSFLGAVALVARNGEVVHHEAYGHQDMARRQPMTRETIFLLASMTKPLTSVATMMLIEEGRISLRDPITDWLPELRDLKVATADGDAPLARRSPCRTCCVTAPGFVYADTAPPRIRDLYRQHDIEARNGLVTGDEMLRRLGHHPARLPAGDAVLLFHQHGRARPPAGAGGGRAAGPPAGRPAHRPTRHGGHPLVGG
jgi:hypothetical protein